MPEAITGVLILVKLVHVMAAIVAVGSNATYTFWLRRAGRDRKRLVDALAGVSRLDSRVASPAYGVLLVTGLWMVIAGGISFTVFWIAAALLLYVATAVIAATLYAPTIRQQMAQAAIDPDAPLYAALERRGFVLGVVTLALVLAIVTLMVTKPML